jgi:glutamate-1-semialdehyde aminotransferase
MSDESGSMFQGDLDQAATRRDLNELQQATRRDLVALEQRLEKRLDDRFADLRRHFDVVGEGFKTEFRVEVDRNKAR